MEYPSIRGEDLPYYDEKATWNLLHKYIDVHIKRLIDEYQGDEAQAITRFQ